LEFKRDLVSRKGAKEHKDFFSFFNQSLFSAINQENMKEVFLFASFAPLHENKNLH